MSNTDEKSKSNSALKFELIEKINNLSDKQLNSVSQYIQFLEYQQQLATATIPQIDQSIKQTIKSYRQQGKSRPSGLAKGEFIVPDDFNDPLPDEILDLFEAE